MVRPSPTARHQPHLATDGFGLHAEDLAGVTELSAGVGVGTGSVG